MQPQDVFGIIVRTFGLFLTFYGVWFLLSGIVRVISPPDATATPPARKARDYIFAALLFCIAGLLLLLRAQAVVQIAY
jgi:hypothetical protein